jgi:hypothetical protein
MRRTALLLVLVLAGIALAAPNAGAGIEEIDYATWDARVTDGKGVATDLFDFGYATGVNILMAYRGDAEVEIPWRRIRRIEIGAYVDVERRAPCTVTLRNGKTVTLEIDNIEETRLLKGKADFGDYRIRMAHVRTIELVRLSHSGDDDARP